MTRGKTMLAAVWLCRGCMPQEEPSAVVLLQAPHVDDIVNGIPTADFPSVGALLNTATISSATMFCSGTLIGCRTFLTAAHCTAQGGNSPVNYGVFLQHAGAFAVESVVVHPLYHSGGFPLYDVAVMRLSRSVEAVTPAPLNTEFLGPYAPFTSLPATIVGFGDDTVVGESGLKRRGAIATASCPNTIPNGATNTEMICWNFAAPLGSQGSNSNTCFGDSGGPLFLQSGHEFSVAGITSGGTQERCLPDDTSFNTNVAHYQSFILEQLGADPVEACGSAAPVGSAATRTLSGVGELSVSRPTAQAQFRVQSGTSQLRIAFNGKVGGGANFDFYVRRGEPASRTQFDCAGTGSGQLGYCEFDDPAPGEWFVLVERIAGEGAFQLVITFVGTAMSEHCGNGLLDSGEDCDGDVDGNCPERCLSDCQCPPTNCGDGELQPPEQCDFGDVVPGDGCSPRCEIECDTDGVCVSTDPCVISSCLLGVCRFEGISDMPCDDGQPCTRDICVEGRCVGVSDDSLICSDGDLCTADRCVQGHCQSTVADCHGLDSDCTQGQCDAATGRCESIAINAGESCGQGGFCASVGVCDAGSCSGELVNCAHLDDACHIGICDDATGQCVSTPTNEAGACDDNNPCSEDDRCFSGVCSGLPKDCSSGNTQCREGVCNSQTGQCIAAPRVDGYPCDDGVLCTHEERCQAGVCTPKNSDCCKSDADCDDGAFCNGAETCDAVFGCRSGLGADCSALDDGCVLGQCDLATDRCIGVVKDTPVCNGRACQSAAQCDDGIFCNGAEVCDPVLGCVSGSPPECVAFSEDCSQGYCDARRDTCVIAAVTDGEVCDDAVFCPGIVGECLAGRCQVQGACVSQRRAKHGGGAFGCAAAPVAEMYWFWLLFFGCRWRRTIRCKYTT
ncbi:MAG: trypsin-like serine protease [Myxococcota bacterium]